MRGGGQMRLKEVRDVGKCCQKLVCRPAIHKCKRNYEAGIKPARNRYIYVHVHIHIHIYICTYTHIQTHTHTHTHTHTQTTHIGQTKASFPDEASLFFLSFRRCSQMFALTAPFFDGFVGTGGPPVPASVSTHK